MRQRRSPIVTGRLGARRGCRAVRHLTIGGGSAITVQLARNSASSYARHAVDEIDLAFSDDRQMLNITVQLAMSLASSYSCQVKLDSCQTTTKRKPPDVQGPNTTQPTLHAQQQLHSSSYQQHRTMSDCLGTRKVAHHQHLGVLDEEQQAAIVRCFWKCDVNSNSRELTEYRSYFNYYAHEIQKLFFGVTTKTKAAATIPSHEVTQICLLVNCLSQAGSKTRQEVRFALRDLLSFKTCQDIQLNSSIDLALRLWLTINVWERKFKHLSFVTPIVEWNDRVPLLEFIAHQFPTAKSTSQSNPPRLKHDFTAVNFDRLSGITIIWTHCLADHLNFDSSQRRLRVYPHKKCLLDHLHRPELSFIPKIVLEETLLTLDLLFPYWDEQTQSFLKKAGHDLLPYGPFEYPRPLDTNEFVIWRDRLIRLYDTYNSPPVGWRQMWHDRRNALQWYTFWLAAVIVVMTFVFGVISSVTSIIQAQAALRSMRDGSSRQY